MSKTYGYVRVSSKDQNEARQLQALGEQLVEGDCIFVDKQSGKDFNRPQYRLLMTKLKAGDLLLIHSLDRLGRNYEEILEQWRIITREKRVDILVLDFPLLDTRARIGEGDLTGRFISDLVLQTLAYVAQKEREAIHQRQAEGIEAAKKRGVRFGRVPMMRPAEYERLKEQYLMKDITAREAARKLGVTHSTFLRWTNEKMDK